MTLQVGKRGKWALLFAALLSLLILPIYSLLYVNNTIPTSGEISYPSPPSFLWYAGFETGDLTEMGLPPGQTNFTTWTTGLGQIWNTGAYSGRHCVRLEGIEDETWWDGIPPDGGARARIVFEAQGGVLYDELYTRFYFKLERSDTTVEIHRYWGYMPGATDGSYITRMDCQGQGKYGDLAWIRVAIGMNKVGKPENWFPAGYTDVVSVMAYPNLTYGDWHRIEIRYKRGNPGGVQVWFDRKLTIDRMDLDTTTGPHIQSIQTGLVTMGQHPGIGNGVIFYQDEIAISTTPIGTYMHRVLLSTGFENDTPRKMTNYREAPPLGFAALDLGGGNYTSGNIAYIEIIENPTLARSGNKVLYCYAPQKSSGETTVWSLLQYLGFGENYRSLRVKWWQRIQTLPEPFRGFNTFFFYADGYQQSGLITVDQQGGSYGIEIRNIFNAGSLTTVWIPLPELDTNWHEFDFRYFLDSTNGEWVLLFDGKEVFALRGINTTPPSGWLVPRGFEIGILNRREYNRSLYLDNIEASTVFSSPQP